MVSEQAVKARIQKEQRMTIHLIISVCKLKKHFYRHSQIWHLHNVVIYKEKRKINFYFYT
jgi:hypothetical protein